ncbi:hypothetical protein LZD49_20320 [Dyadobacter sp. CY261]|uniref:hypothetical protein n=1 Tax=Dyadobacter sp. CY261 TaxID=2907203 RepID=UPI001F3F37CC|nr:hypothetical protein [Dyadobacter sp. CY261]MCF0072837.1 hypothetical protein [Dyadobacter sp. CY261]
MNKVSLFILVLIAFGQCKTNDLEPVPEIASIVGKWKVTAYSRTVGDSLITESVLKDETIIMVIRHDGVIADEQGRQRCCSPSKYLFNGKEFIPKPAATVDPADCSLVLCNPCMEMKITTPMSDPNVLAIECDGSYTWYVREK